ncbi:acyl carrier protein [Azospirillum griseum]|uniref:Acyl carrier protein n=2 Tax=Azospirillum griseum TaxID=2496639 RepID=A0A431VI77_9PROT|nr:acyl carrier protein [Azospirillum griseum]
MAFRASIKQFLVEEFMPDVSMGQIEDDFDLIANGVIDSLGLLKVIAWLESRHELSIDVMDMVPENFSSVGAINAYLNRAKQLTAA